MSQYANILHCMNKRVHRRGVVKPGKSTDVCVLTRVRLDTKSGKKSINFRRKQAEGGKSREKAEKYVFPWGQRDAFPKNRLYSEKMGENEKYLLYI